MSRARQADTFIVPRTRLPLATKTFDMFDIPNLPRNGFTEAVYGLGKTSVAYKQEYARHCDSCTLCCSGVLRLEVEGNAIHPGHACRHCRKSGCGIYKTRPAVCRHFVCGWLQNADQIPHELRPDLSGVVLLSAYLRWRGKPVDVAVAASQGAHPDALLWLKNFSRMHQRPLIYQTQVDGIWYGFGSTTFRADLTRFLEHGGSLFKK